MKLWHYGKWTRANTRAGWPHFFSGHRSRSDPEIRATFKKDAILWVILPFYLQHMEHGDDIWGGYNDEGPA